jgi:hypothetical protein
MTDQPSDRNTNGRAGRVVINSLIYAEVSVGYQTVEELEELLPAADAGFLYRRACRHNGLPAADARRRPVPDLLPDHQHHRPAPGRRRG